MRQSAPAVARNRGPILEVLRRVLPPHGTVLELASGTGEHAVFFAAQMPHLVWQPSDADEAARASIEAWRLDAGLPNERAPLALDVLDADPWAIASADAILNVNMIHISPWAATLGLMRHSSRLLSRGAPLVMYGPYRRRDVVTAASNEAFDASLRARNEAWGVRHLDDVVAAAGEAGLAFDEVIEVPANNIIVVFRRV